MAATVVNGANVTVTIGSAVVKIAAISLTTGQGTFDISAFGSGSYVDRIGGGLKDLAGSASGFLQSGDAAANPFALVDNAVGTMLITFDSTAGTPHATVSFSVIVGNVTVDISRAGIGVVRFDFSKADSADPTIGTWA